MGVRNTTGLVVAGLVLTGLVGAELMGTSAPTIAHQVQIADDVGGTVHIEPNDNPRAGTPSLAWFALTRQGGELIPLQDCTCQLSVYAQPRQPGDLPVQQPLLQPVAAEGYQNVPGANITFPQIGAYELVLQGEPTTSEDFLPFELTFAVTVATGQAGSPSPVPVTPDTESSASEPESIAPTPIANAPATEQQTWLFWIVPLVVLAIGLVGWRLRWRK